MDIIKKKSDSSEQQKSEAIIFELVQKLLGFTLEANPKISIANSVFSYIQPDFYSEERKIIGEIFSHIGKPKKAQDNKIANDILKMLLLEKKRNCKYRKIIAVCDEMELKKLHGQSALAESIREFGIEVIMIEIDQSQKKIILEAQERQKMVNVE